MNPLFYSYFVRECRSQDSNPGQQQNTALTSVQKSSRASGSNFPLDTWGNWGPQVGGDLARQNLLDENWQSKIFDRFLLILIILVDFLKERRGRRKGWGEGKFWILHHIATVERKNCFSSAWIVLLPNLHTLTSPLPGIHLLKWLPFPSQSLFIFFLAPITKMFILYTYVFICSSFSHTKIWAPREVPFSALSPGPRIVPGPQETFKKYLSRERMEFYQPSENPVPLPE